MKLFFTGLAIILFASFTVDGFLRAGNRNHLAAEEVSAENRDTNWFDVDTILSKAQYVMYAVVQSNSAMAAHTWLRCLSDDSVRCWEGDMGMHYGYYVNSKGDTLMNGHWPKTSDSVLVITYPLRTFTTTPAIKLFAHRESHYYRCWYPYNLFYRPTYFKVTETVLPIPQFADQVIVHNGVKYCPDGCLYPVKAVLLKER